jgi:hypothetical protein
MKIPVAARSEFVDLQKDIGDVLLVAVIPSLENNEYCIT